MRIRGDFFGEPLDVEFDSIEIMQHAVDSVQLSRAIWPAAYQAQFRLINAVSTRDIAPDLNTEYLKYNGMYLYLGGIPVCINIQETTPQEINENGRFDMEITLSEHHRICTTKRQLMMYMLTGGT